MRVAAPLPLPMDDRSTRLRQRLVEMRAAHLERMLRRGSVDPGLLPVMAGIEGALAALDKEEPAAAGEAIAEEDEDGENVRLTVRAGVQMLAVVLPPMAALRIAVELLDSCGCRLERKLLTGRGTEE